MNEQNLIPGNHEKRLGRRAWGGKFMEACREMADDPRALEYIGKILRREPTEKRVVFNTETMKNETTLVPLDAEAWIKVWEKVANRGFGMPTVEVDLGENARMLLVRPAAAALAAKIVDVKPEPQDNANGNGHRNGDAS